MFKKSVKTAFKITSKNLVEGLGTQNRNFHISALEKMVVILFFSKHDGVSFLVHEVIYAIFAVVESEAASVVIFR